MKRFRYFILLLLLLPVLAGAQDTLVHIETINADSLEGVRQHGDNDYQDDEEEDSNNDKQQSRREFLPLYLVSEDSFHLRKVSDAKRRELREDDAYWYANASFKKEEQKAAGRSSLSWLEPVMWVLVIAGFITFLVIFLMNGNVGIFRRSKAIREEISETDFEDIFSINYQVEIDKAVAAGQYNLAVRLLFLRLLRSLSERNIIDYKQDRTNFDYLMQLQRSKYYQDFFRLTRHYEYSWYGQFPLEKQKLEMIRVEFDHFDRNLN